MSLLSLTTDVMQRIVSATVDTLRTHAIDVELGWKASGPGRGGVLLLVARTGKLRAVMKQLIPKLQQDIHPNIHLDHVSWEQDLEYDGASIEQCNPSDSPPAWLGANLVRCTVLMPHQTIQHTFYASAEAAANECDIVIDRGEHKIWIKGKPVTSRQLPSQTMVAELMAYLMVKQNFSVKNIELPESSYASYRNELQSKVIGPFKRLVEERLGTTLHLNITGSLTRFTITLAPSRLTIGIIDSSVHIG